MGGGRQLLEQLLLTSACLGGPSVGYGSFFVLGLSRMPWAPSCASQGCCSLPPAPAKDAPGSQAGRHFLRLYFSRHLLSVLFPIITRSPLWLLLRQGIGGVPLVPAGRGCPGSGSDPTGAPRAVPPTPTSGAGRWELSLLVPCYQHPCQSRALAPLKVLGAWRGMPTTPCAIVAASCPDARCSPPCSRVVWKRG